MIYLVLVRVINEALVLVQPQLEPNVKKLQIQTHPGMFNISYICKIFALKDLFVVLLCYPLNRSTDWSCHLEILPFLQEKTTILLKLMYVLQAPFFF